MKSARLYQCVRCHRQCIICRNCDRGNIYCELSCAQQARVQNRRIANKVYQKTFRGKQKHADRQRSYLLRQKDKVTDQGSPQIPGNDLLPPRAFNEKSMLKKIAYCHFCNAPVSDFFRNGYLMHSRNKNLMLKNDQNAQDP